MDKRVWKYTLETVDKQTFSLPANAKLLKIVMLKGDPYLYAMVDLRNERENITILTFGTGQNIPNDKVEYIDTYINKQWGLVWHVFKKEK